MNNSDKGSGNTLRSSSQSYRTKTKVPQHLDCIIVTTKKRKESGVLASGSIIQVDYMYNIFCINRNYTILEAIERIEDAKNRAVIVLNDDECVVGILSQGDIIRALISGIDLHSQIGRIIRSNFFYIKEYDLKQAYGIFKKYELTILPVIDDNYHLLSVITIKDIYRYIDNE